MEAYAVRQADGLVAVSPDYLDELGRRYPAARAFKNGNCAAIPFGVLLKDFELVREPSGSNENHDKLCEIAYVGVGAEIMAKSFRRIADGVARLRQREPELISRLRFRFSGTDGRWSEGRPKILQEQAQAAGIGDLVEENPRIIAYREATRRAVVADGLLVLGVNDPAYMPSKLFPYALTGKPLLACMHGNSQVNAYFQRLPEIGTLIHFDGPAENEAAEDALLLAFLRQVAERKTFARENVRAEFSAAAMARKHAELFDQIVASSESRAASHEP